MASGSHQGQGMFLVHFPSEMNLNPIKVYSHVSVSTFTLIMEGVGWAYLQYSPQAQRSWRSPFSMLIPLLTPSTLLLV